MVTTRANVLGEDVATSVEGNQELTRRIAEKGDWFHNINLNGVQTAPHHFLGDFPNVKWKHIAPELPQDLSGASVLDIGCNGGFYSIELKKRGASRVLGVDVDDRYLEQARFASQILDWTSNSPSAPSTTWTLFPESSISSCLWEFFITCAILCSRSIRSLRKSGKA